jgi:hypothetical protein
LKSEANAELENGRVTALEFSMTSASAVTVVLRFSESSSDSLTRFRTAAAEWVGVILHAISCEIPMAFNCSCNETPVKRAKMKVARRDSDMVFVDINVIAGVNLNVLSLPVLDLSVD